MTHSVAVYGGSFDPVHCAHVALVRLVHDKVRPDLIRILPAGNPWQKEGLQAGGAERVAMARLAFQDSGLPVDVDDREVRRAAPTYTVDTLRELRAELGPDAAIVFAMGADQLRRLHTWREWQALSGLANLFVVSRPGCSVAADDVDPAVARLFAERAAAPDELRKRPHGAACIVDDLQMDISATDVRAALARGERPAGLVPDAVLDYIQQHHLYQKN